MVALEDELRLGVAGDAVEEDGFFDGRHQGVADAAQHGVEGPDGVLVLAFLGQGAHIVFQVRLALFG